MISNTMHWRSDSAAPASCHDLAETRPLSGDSEAVGDRVSPGWFKLPDELVNHPRYEVVEFLGAGGMGVVYKARHRLMHRTVALKIINRSLLGRPDVVERFHREVRAAGRLTHPNIVHAYDADRAGDTHFLIMEFVDGVDLELLLLREERLPVDQACAFARQAALGLHHAYERGMIHRDIKPHNLMVTPAGQIKILDFGLARFVDQGAAPTETCSNTGPAMAAAAMPNGASGTGNMRSDATSQEAQVGTADYMAPEVVDDPSRADIRSDIYSLGCTLYRMLSGQLPCGEGTLAQKLECQQQGDVVPLKQVCPDLPEKLLSTVDRMLRKDPAERFQTPLELAQALERFDPRHMFRILVVDDDALTRNLTMRTLIQQGYDVSSAGNGQEALTHLQMGPPPDLILLDLMMPVMTGWQFLAAIKQQPRWAAIPIMVISSNDPIETGAMAAGANDYLHKPMRIDELAAKVAAFQFSSEA